MRAKHRFRGLPRYRPGHHPNPIRLAYEALRAQGFMMLGEVCEKLGIGQTTLRRYDVFTAEDLKRLRNKLRRRVRL